MSIRADGSDLPIVGGVMVQAYVTLPGGGG